MLDHNMLVHGTNKKRLTNKAQATRRQAIEGGVVCVGALRGHVGVNGARRGNTEASLDI